MRVRVTRNDEIGDLGHAFNDMAERLETLLTAERRLLQDISHELRSPLARLNIAIELARRAEDRDAAALLFDGITVTGADRSEQIVTLVIVGAIFGAITSFVKPVIALFSLPVIVLTFGLFLLVINALMLLLTSVIADGLDLGFHVDGFVTAVLGSIVISIVSALVSIVLPDA